MTPEEIKKEIDSTAKSIAENLLIKSASVFGSKTTSRWLFIGRVINNVFCWHYRASLEEAEQRLAEVIDHEPERSSEL